MAKRQMLINYVAGEECRIAIVEEGRLEELYQERASSGSHVGNIYKGRVTNVEPSIQAAFIDFGLERHGFLHITDLHPMYFRGDQKEDSERVGHKTPRRDRPPIQKCLRRGQEVLVQILKEGIGTKGPTVTSYLSIPGRFLVMMPSMERLGVSRKVEDDEARREMRKILDDLDPPKEFGFIVRTAGVGRTKVELKRDLAYLLRLWKRMGEQQARTKTVGELYTESDLIIRTIRDVYSSDIEQIIVDDEDAARRAHDFLSIANPRSGSSVMVYRDPTPLFDRYDLERQIETIHSREAPLPSGGSLVIEQTEALVAIDVNSGKSRDARDAETNAFKTNTEACDEICRQLRLRDLGGVIIHDLIDMRLMKHRRAIEQRFRLNLKKDRARTRIGSISSFGILEMTRQRMRPSLKKSIYTECSACQATGHVKSSESVVLAVMRQLALVMHRREVAKVELTISPDVAFQLLNRKRAQLVELERKYDAQVLVRVNAHGSVDAMGIAAFDERGGVVDTQARVHAGEPTLIAVTQLKPAKVSATPVAAQEQEQASNAVKPPEQADKAAPQAQASKQAEAPEEKDAAKTGRRRRRRRKKSAGSDAAGAGEPDRESSSEPTPPAGPQRKDVARPQAGPTVGGPMADADAHEPSGTDDESDEATGGGEGGKKSRRGRRRRGGRRRRKSGEAATQDSGDGSEGGDDGDGSREKRENAGADSPRPALKVAAKPTQPAPTAKPAPRETPAGSGYRNPKLTIQPTPSAKS